MTRVLEHVSPCPYCCLTAVVDVPLLHDSLHQHHLIPRHSHHFAFESFEPELAPTLVVLDAAAVAADVTSVRHCLLDYSADGAFDELLHPPPPFYIYNLLL
jgi:hypothetical protein